MFASLFFKFIFEGEACGRVVLQMAHSVILNVSSEVWSNLWIRPKWLPLAFFPFDATNLIYAAKNVVK